MLDTYSLTGDSLKWCVCVCMRERVREEQACVVWCLIVFSYRLKNTKLVTLVTVLVFSVRIKLFFRLVRPPSGTMSTPCKTLSLQVSRMFRESQWWSCTAQSAGTCTHPSPLVIITLMASTLAQDFPTCSSWCIRSSAHQNLPINLSQGL